MAGVTRRVRIAGGVWRGRALRYPEGIRPTMQRTKESLFSSLGDEIHGAVFTDLFAGAGGMGIEALSRGASRVHFVESAAAPLRALRENVKHFGAEEKRVRIHPARVDELLRARPCPIADAEIVFADPPYDVDLQEAIFSALDVDACAALRRLIVEHRAKVPVIPGPGLRVERSRRFGETMLTYFVPEREREGAEEESL